MPRFVYTLEHIAFLSAHFKVMSCEDLTQTFNKEFGFNKSVATIKATLSNHKITSGRKTGHLKKGTPKIVNAEQKQWIIDNYPKMSAIDTTKELNRIFDKNLTLRQFKTFVKNHSIQSGRTGTFSKGYKSWNEGTKGLMKPNKTSFKKGNKPHNYSLIGTERITKDGYIEVKTAEPKTWTAKHHIIWEQHNGPLPKGAIIRFKDSDPTNLDPSNLIKMNRSEHHFLNKLNLKDCADEHKDTVILIARVQSKTAEVKANV